MEEELLWLRAVPPTSTMSLVSSMFSQGTADSMVRETTTTKQTTKMVYFIRLLSLALSSAHFFLDKLVLIFPPLPFFLSLHAFAWT